MNFATIPLFDYILLAVLVLFVVEGFRVGLLRQLCSVLSFIGSYAVSALYAGELRPYLAQVTENPKDIFGIIFLILLIISTPLLKLIGKLLGKVVQVKIVGRGTRLFLAASLALLKVVTLLIILQVIGILPSSHFFRDSLPAPYLEQGSDIARSVIQDAEIREALKPREAPVKKKEEERPQVQAPIQQEEKPLNPAPQQIPPPEAGNDDPAGSTEIIH